MTTLQKHPTMPHYRRLLSPAEFQEIVSKGMPALVEALSRYVRETGGRKKTGTALSGSERVRLYRLRKREREELEEQTRLKGERAAARKGGAKGSGKGRSAQ